MARTPSRASVGAHWLHTLCLAVILAASVGVNFGTISNSGFYKKGEENIHKSGAGSTVLEPEFTTDGWVFKVVYIESEPKPATQKLYLKVVDYDTKSATSVTPICDRDAFKPCIWKEKDKWATYTFPVIGFETSGEFSVSGVSLEASKADDADAGVTANEKRKGVAVNITITERALQALGMSMKPNTEGEYATGVIIGYYEEAHPGIYDAFHQKLFKINSDDRACDKDQKAST